MRRAMPLTAEQMAEMVRVIGVMKLEVDHLKAAAETAMSVSSEIKLRMKALYHLLESTTRDRAADIMQMVPKNGGASGRRRLKAEYAPRSGGRLTAMLMGMLRVR